MTMLSSYHHTHIHELPGDVPPTPMSTVSSHPSLKPGPLNFSRPRYAGADSYGFRSESSSENQRNRSRLSSYNIQSGNEQNRDQDLEDAANPPPAIRTYTHLEPLDSPRDSIDDAIPPPIATRGVQRTFEELQQSNDSIGDSIFEDFPAPPVPRSQPSSSRNSVPSRREDSVVEASLSSNAKKQFDISQGIVQPNLDAPRVCIYRPYLDYASSNHSSVDSPRATDSTSETNTSDELEFDRQSQTESESSDFDFMVDYAFNGQIGWNPRKGAMSAASPAQRQSWIPTPSPLHIPQVTPKGKERQEIKDSEEKQLSIQQRQDSTASISEHTLSPATTSSSGSSSTRSKPPKIPARIPRIVKRTSLDQISEHVNPWQGESMSDRGSISSNEWKSSDVDTGGLSIEKIHKLKKKGINPALYVEMQNARKGKSKWISPLGGNSFLS